MKIIISFTIFFFSLNQKTEGLIEVRKSEGRRRTVVPSRHIFVVTLTIRRSTEAGKSGGGGGTDQNTFPPRRYIPFTPLSHRFVFAASASAHEAPNVRLLTVSSVEFSRSVCAYCFSKKREPLHKLETRLLQWKAKMFPVAGRQAVSTLRSRLDFQPFERVRFSDPPPRRNAGAQNGW